MYVSCSRPSARPTGLGAPVKPCFGNASRKRWMAGACGCAGRSTISPRRKTAPAFVIPPLSTSSTAVSIAVPMLDQVWSFLRGDAPEGLYERGHNVMLYEDDVPNVEVGVQVSGPFAPTGPR